MNKYIILLLLINSLPSLAQDTGILALEMQKKEIADQINILNDSIRKIDLKIHSIKSREIQKMVTDSTLKASARKGAKIKTDAKPLSEIIYILSEDSEVIILDYIDGFFGVCSDSICGYMSEFWISTNEELTKFIKAKKVEGRELERIKKEQSLKAQDVEWAELEKKYIKKYGKETYAKLKQGYFWIGMDKEMASLALGTPKDINRSVGAWGVHEQWVYNNLYLYFENGKLKSYQD